MPPSKRLAILLIAISTSCSTAKNHESLGIDFCVVSNVDSISCRCVKPNGDFYSISIEECAEKRYNALSPDDAAKLYSRLFQLESDLNQCEVME